MSESSTVYGPVKSWRLGMSLGVDLLCVNSICSFRCIYCQLGKINLHTNARKVFVPTEKVMADLSASNWASADVVTLSGSGEPTLAANMGGVMRQIKSLTAKPLVVLTNATTLNDEAVRRELFDADKVFCKLDAADEETFSRVNRPVEGVTLRSLIEGIKAFRREYGGSLAIQTMLMHAHLKHTESFAEILKQIRPDEVQLNLPLRTVPHRWSPSARGNHEPSAQSGVRLKTISPDDAKRFEAALQNLTGLKIVSAIRQNN